MPIVNVYDTLLKPQILYRKTAYRFKCASVYIDAYNLLHLIFAVFEGRLVQHRIDCMQFFSYILGPYILSWATGYRLKYK